MRKLLVTVSALVRLSVSVLVSGCGDGEDGKLSSWTAHTKMRAMGEADLLPTGGAQAEAPERTAGMREDDELLTCATATMGTPSALHAAAAAALIPADNKECAFSSCHDANSKKANLALLETTADLTMQIVGKMS